MAVHEEGFGRGVARQTCIFERLVVILHLRVDHLPADALCCPFSPTVHHFISLAVCVIDVIRLTEHLNLCKTILGRYLCVFGLPLEFLQVREQVWVIRQHFELLIELPLSLIKVLLILRV